MKELPYFKFSPIEYINADISFCNYELQGIFIQICSLSWTRNCSSIAINMLEQRFNNAKLLIAELLEKDILKTDEKGVYISFLREQFNELKGKHELRVKAGSLGGVAKSSNAKAMVQQCPSNKDKEEDKIKKKKKNKIFIAPTLEEFKNYFKEKGYSLIIAERAWNGYNVAEWHKSNGEKILNWKQTCFNVWFKEENKINNNKPVFFNG